MSDRLVVTIVMHDNYHLMSSVLSIVHDLGGNILESRFSNFESTSLLIMLIDGSWDVYAKIEPQLKQFCQKQEYLLTMRRAKPRQYELNVIPYTAHVTCLNEPGILAQLTKYFTEQQIEIHELYNTTYLSQPGNTPMAYINLTVLIPPDSVVADLREHFIIFCESLNIDAIFEPEKV